MQALPHTKVMDLFSKNLIRSRLHQISVVVKILLLFSPVILIENYSSNSCVIVYIGEDL